jgi:hypothetical protein
MLRFCERVRSATGGQSMHITSYTYYELQLGLNPVVVLHKQLTICKQ